MDLLDLLKLMFRRWYVTAPIIIVTLGAALAVGYSIQPEYRTSVAIVLVPPATSVTAPAPGASPQPVNPWLRIGESAMAQAVQIAASRHDARTTVTAAGGHPDYEVELVVRSSILTIDIAADTQPQALATVDAVTRLITDEVARQQAPYRPGAGEQITTQVLDPGRNIAPSRSNVLRLQIVLVSIGLLLAAAMTVLYDAVARRRATIRSRELQTAGTGRPATPRRRTPDQVAPTRPDDTALLAAGPLADEHGGSRADDSRTP